MILKNPRWEQFAGLVAGGRTPSEAYACVGYKETNAPKAGSRLAKKAEIRARIVELCSAAAQSRVSQEWLNRNFVIAGLKTVFDRALNLDKLGDANGALKMLGTEIGMFVDRTDHTIQWNGDLSQLNAAQLQKMMAILEQIAFNGNPELIAAAKAEAIETLQ